jgi:hypothetical protein
MSSSNEWERDLSAYSTFAIHIPMAPTGDDVAAQVAQLCQLDGSCSVLLHRLHGNGRTLGLEGAWNCEPAVRAAYTAIPLDVGLLPVCDSVLEGTLIREPVGVVLDVYPMSGALLWDVAKSDYEIFDFCAIPLTANGARVGGLTVVSNWDSAVTDADLDAFDVIGDWLSTLTD